MWRFLAGVGSALLLCGAGLVWWTSTSEPAPLLTAVQPPLARSPESTETVAPPQAEERTREEKRFDRYDKDRDQSITAEEYLASRRKAYAKLDANGDGRLSFEEWAKKTTDKFGKADADRSRTLSRAEFATTKVVRKTPARRDCPPPAREEEDS
jgi:uncharacterized protein YxeA